MWLGRTFGPTVKVSDRGGVLVPGMNSENGDMEKLCAEAKNALLQQN